MVKRKTEVEKEVVELAEEVAKDGGRKYGGDFGYLDWLMGEVLKGVCDWLTRHLRCGVSRAAPRLNAEDPLHACRTCAASPVWVCMMS